MIKFLCKSILFAACLAASYFYLCESYEAAAQKNLINAWNRQRFDDFYQLPDHFLDMVFIGSSHSYCSFNPTFIDAALGTESFQMGMPLQHPDASYYTLREIFKTQSPETVVMEVYWDVLRNDFDLKQSDTLFQVLRGEDIKKEYRETVFPWNEKIKYSIPLIRYQQDFWAWQSKALSDWTEKTFGVQKQTEIQNGVERYADRGFMYCDYVISESKFGAGNQYMHFDGRQWKFSSVQKKYLQKIIALCRANGARLLFVTAPVAPVSMSMIKNYETVHNAVENFATQHQVPYLDFNQIDLPLENAHFRDDAHLNYSGAVIADRVLANWINSLLTDTR